MSVLFATMPAASTAGVTETFRKEPMMYLEASDHACPHLREQRATEMKPVLASPPRQASCPFGAGRAAAEPLRLASTGSAGGWWAFAAEARAMTAAA